MIIRLVEGQITWINHTHNVKWNFESLKFDFNQFSVMSGQNTIGKTLFQRFKTFQLVHLTLGARSTLYTF